MTNEQKKRVSRGTWCFRGGFLAADHQGETTVLAGMVRYGKRGRPVAIHDAPFSGFQDGYFYANKEEQEANLALILEAARVLEQTGMSPAELLDKLVASNTNEPPAGTNCPHQHTEKVFGRPEWCLDCNTEL
jgi:hypothetical protein